MHSWFIHVAQIRTFDGCNVVMCPSVTYFGTTDYVRMPDWEVPMLQCLIWCHSHTDATDQRSLHGYKYTLQPQWKPGALQAECAYFNAKCFSVLGRYCAQWPRRVRLRNAWFVAFDLVAASVEFEFSVRSAEALGNVCSWPTESMDLCWWHQC